MSTTDRRSRTVLPAVFLVSVALAACGRGPDPPAPDVVATYTGGQVTLDQVRRLVDGDLKELRVVVGDKLEAVSPAPGGVYRGLVQELVDAMVRQSLESVSSTEGDPRHALKHGEEEVSLDRLR
jgi:hypothetical protein